MKFNELTHEYSLNGEIYKSATEFISEFFPEFERDKIANFVAKATGQTAEEVIKEWVNNTELGNKVHKYAEMRVTNPQIAHDIFIQNQNDEKLKNFMLQVNKLHNIIEPFEAESVLYNTKYKIAGTCDLIAKYQDDICIMDYKTGSVDNKKRGTGLKGTPCEDIANTKLNKITLQLSLYRYLLETRNIIIKKLYIIDLKPDGFELLEVQYLRAKIIEMLDYKAKEENKMAELVRRLGAETSEEGVFIGVYDNGNITIGKNYKSNNEMKTARTFSLTESQTLREYLITAEAISMEQKAKSSNGNAIKEEIVELNGVKYKRI